MSERSFPVMATGGGVASIVPWDFVAPHERRAQVNHGQTLSRLAERGGLDWTELYAVLTDRCWSEIAMAEEGCRVAVMTLLQEWFQARAAKREAAG